ncbi:MAG: hypothetical protein MSA29_08065 [Lachnospiraceae bacterium]|nr:hypothetical protein [Lachnospiraceae bacterium]
MGERELNLLDMIADILSHWKGILIALLIGAVLMGGFSYVKSYRSVQNEQAAVPTVLDRVAVDKQLEQIEATLKDSDKATVLTTVSDEWEYLYKNKYAQESVYMQLDPLNVAQIELVYGIRALDEEQAQCLGTIYKNLLDNVGLYDWVEQQTGIPEVYVGELISVDTNLELSLGKDDKSIVLGSDTIKVTMIQTDEIICEQLASAIKDYVEQQQKNLVTEVGNHTLVLLSETSGMIMDADVMNDQIDYGNQISDLRSKIVSEKSEFTVEQQQYYNLLTWEEAEKGEVEQLDTTEEQPALTRPSVSKKYVLLGAVLLAFVYAGSRFLMYIFNTRIRISDEMESLYHIPQIGVVVKDSKKKFILDRWVDELRHYGKRMFDAEQSMELAFVAVKIAVIKNKLSNVCLMGCNLSAGAGNVCEKLKVALEKDGIDVIVLDNVLYNAESMEKMDDVTGVVLVEKAGSTLYNEIANELAWLKRQDITVLGGIVVE